VAIHHTPCLDLPESSLPGTRIAGMLAPRPVGIVAVIREFLELRLCLEWPESEEESEAFDIFGKKIQLYLY